jgi:tetratricopeptide (TPR) repeat protein
MQTACFVVLGWLFATVAFAGPAPAVTRQRNWVGLRSPNFTVLGDAGAGDIRRVAMRLEEFRDALSVLLPTAIQAASRPTTVVVFRNQRTFEPFQPQCEGKAQSLAGYFIAGEAAHYIALTGEGDDAFEVIYHEYVHAVMNAVVSSPPVWFNEGLAEYYKTLEVTNNGRQALIGRLDIDHVFRLRNEWLPLAAVLAVAHDSPLYNERAKATVFYAESWALAHYLLLAENRAYATHVGPFAALLTSGVAPTEACQQAFGLTLTELEKRLRRYVNQTAPLPMMLVTLSQRLTKIAESPVTPVPDAEAHAILGELLFRLRRPDEARAQLDAALALDSTCGLAHESMGRLLTEARQFSEARDHLAAAIAAPGATWLTHYTYGRVLVEARSDPSAAANEEMARAFAQAVEMKPDFADGYAQLAWVRSQLPATLEDAVRAARKATELAPGTMNTPCCSRRCSPTAASSRRPAPFWPDSRGPRRTRMCSSPLATCWRSSSVSTIPQKALRATLPRTERQPERMLLRPRHADTCPSSVKAGPTSAAWPAGSPGSTAARRGSCSR